MEARQCQGERPGLDCLARAHRGQHRQAAKATRQGLAEVLFHVERRILSNFAMDAIHQRHRLWARYRGDLAFRDVGAVGLLVLAVPINDGSQRSSGSNRRG